LGESGFAGLMFGDGTGYGPTGRAYPVALFKFKDWQ